MNWKEKMSWLHEPDDPDTDYCKLALKDFISGYQIPFTIYIKIHDKKYTKLADQGEDLSDERIQTYKQKGLDYLYVKKEDFRQCVNFHIELTEDVKKSPKIPFRKKKGFLNLTSNLILENLYVNGVNKEDFDGAKEFLSTSMDMMTDDESTFNLLKKLNKHTNYLYAHSLGVSLYSVMIAKRMSKDFPKVHFIVSMGGLFHDIGKKEISELILEKKRAALTQGERAILESHVPRGVDILDSLGNAPESVIQSVAQHHEDCLGTGHPNHLKKNDIIPTSRIISVANVFCNYAIKNPQSRGLSAKDSIDKMITVYGSRLDQNAFLALKELFGLVKRDSKNEEKLVIA